MGDSEVGGSAVNNGTWTYWWEHGRQLAYMKQGTTVRWDYTYNVDGLRTERTNGTDTYRYGNIDTPRAIAAELRDRLFIIAGYEYY